VDTSPSTGKVGGVARSSVLGRVERRHALRSRLAGAGIVLVLLAVSAFAVWSSGATAVAAGRASSASRLADDFAQAATAVAAEESLERKYRLEPGPEIRADYEAASTDLVLALARADADGPTDVKALVDQVSDLHEGYVEALERMFAAVDRGDTEEVSRIDAEEVDPSFVVIHKLISVRAAKEHAVAVTQLNDLEQLGRVTRGVTPWVFVLGLLLVAVLASITRGYRRVLDSERASATYDSLHDALTGLPNRTLLAERFAHALHHGWRENSLTGLLLIDLDRFKEVNDTFGHHYGDELLTQVGPRLSEHLRPGDTIARLGGDEFAVLLPGVVDLAGATAVADALILALEAPFHVEGVELDIEASIGIVLSGEHGADAATLLQRADIAMYVAKGKSRGVSVYDPTSDRHSPERLALLGELRRAIENDELVLFFQPQIRVGTGEVTGVEALVRWHHPVRGIVFPDDFVPIAEHTGMIGPLTRWVVNAALAQAELWCDQGQPLQVAVNLSARNLIDEDLPDEVADLLAIHHMPASLLKLEVTESAIMSDPLRAAAILGRLADSGIEISIDDFGVGYTSLGQLKTLPVTELKIDRSFVMSMTESASDRLIVHSVVELGHNLGLTIVAEGVETLAELEQLSLYGCDNAQGYYLSRPIPAAAFDEWRAEYGDGAKACRTWWTPLEVTKP